MVESAGPVCRGADFCGELVGGSDTEFGRVYGGSPESRVICRGKHLSVLADMSPLCVGHLLLVPDRHYLSFAEVARDREVEVKDVKNQVFGLYRKTFGNPVILEHGSSYGMDGSSCITHAHWHLLPLTFDAIHQVMVGDGLAWVELGGLRDLAVMGEGATYFYCADRYRSRLYGVGQARRRQYLRSVAGAILGIPDPEWDYAVVVRKDLLRATMAATTSWRIDT